MFAKVTVHTEVRTLPVLLAAASSQRIEQMSSLLSWDVYGGELTSAAGELRIVQQELRLSVRNQLLLPTGEDPSSPQGWWEAVAGLDGHVVAVFVPAHIDLTLESLTETVEGEIKGACHTAQALFPVVTTPFAAPLPAAFPRPGHQEVGAVGPDPADRSRENLPPARPETEHF